MHLTNFVESPLFTRVASASDLPITPGVYLLFNQDGHPIYVGMTDDLRRRMGEHDKETDNFWLRLYARYFVCVPTGTRELARVCEGAVFDAFVRQYCSKPLANHDIPPASRYNNPLLRGIAGITAN